MYESVLQIVEALHNAENYPLVLLAIFAAIELVVRLTPTEKDNSILNGLLAALVKLANILPNKATSPDGKKASFSLKSFITKTVKGA